MCLTGLSLNLTPISKKRFSQKFGSWSKNYQKSIIKLCAPSRYTLIDRLRNFTCLDTFFLSFVKTHFRNDSSEQFDEEKIMKKKQKIMSRCVQIDRLSASMCLAIVQVGSA